MTRGEFLSRFRHGWSLLSACLQKKRAAVFCVKIAALGGWVIQLLGGCCLCGKLKFIFLKPFLPQRQEIQVQ